MAQNNSWAIGVDLGGTKIQLAAVNAAGRLEHRIRVKTDVKGGPTAVIAEIITAVKDIRKKMPATPVAIGVAIAGQIDEKQGVVRFAPNLGWHNVPFADNLSGAVEVPVVLMNDVRAATWGEWLHGAGRNCDDFICLFVGTGVGGGVVSGGRMIEGCTNTAGELGHITIDMSGPRCTCRNSGCLEAFAGGWAIARSAQDAIKHEPEAGAHLLKRAEGLLNRVSAKIVVQAMHEGDSLARRLMENVERALTAGSVTLVNAFNPCRLILGGGVVEGIPGLVDRIGEGLAKSALAAAIDRIEVLPAQLRHDAGVIGMAAYALRTIHREKIGRSAA
jgi:glucokinase